MGLEGAAMIDYDVQYEFRYADVSDINELMIFINDNWKSGHILSKNKELFEYEFLKENGDVNFLMAIDKEKNTIEGVIGFLETAYNQDTTDVWTSIWKVREGNMLFLGSELQKRLESKKGIRYVMGIGDNPDTSARILKKKFGRNIIKMKHYYILSDRDQFYVAKVMHRDNANNRRKFKENIFEIHSIEQLTGSINFNNCQDLVPQKNSFYYEKRFFKHPIYTYKIFAIGKKDKADAFFVVRTQECNNRKVLRVVDYYGEEELIEEMGIWLKEKIESENYEYADFLCYGFEHRFFVNGGFSLLKEDDDNIIPDYFYPFERRNIDILCDYPDVDIRICKADGDQDRPN